MFRGKRFVISFQFLRNLGKYLRFRRLLWKTHGTCGADLFSRHASTSVKATTVKLDKYFVQVWSWLAVERLASSPSLISPGWAERLPSPSAAPWSGHHGRRSRLLADRPALAASSSRARSSRRRARSLRNTIFRPWALPIADWGSVRVGLASPILGREVTKLRLGPGLS